MGVGGRSWANTWQDRDIRRFENRQFDPDTGSKHAVSKIKHHMYSHRVSAGYMFFM